MGTLKVRHLRQRGGNFYFQPSKSMREGGFYPEALGDDVAKAVARVEAYNAEWDVLRTASAPPKTGRVGWLIDEYERLSWYRDLKPRTKEGADFALERVRGAFGDWRVRDIGRGDVRRWYEKIHAKRGLSTANRCLKYLRRLMTFALDLELRTDNPAAGLQVKHERPRRVRWEPDQVGRFIGAALVSDRFGWALAVAIGYDTGQRLGDILAATWTQRDGSYLRFTQAKTDAETDGLLSARTLALLDEAPRGGAVTIVTGRDGAPIKGRYFQRRFSEIAEAAGLPKDLWFKDLRRTAASEVLAGGGRAEPITGHRPGSSVIKHYEVPNREAVKSAQEARRRGRARNNS